MTAVVPKKQLDQYLLFFAPSVDWYVATTGSDSNAGTSGAPWATLARVVTELQKYVWLNQVRVYIAAGTYAGVQWDGANFVPGGKLALIAQSTTVLSSGTVLAGSTKVLLNAAAYGGTNNLWRKSLRRKTAGGVMLDERSITANTATTLQPAVPFTTVPAAGELWEVFEPAVIFDYSAFAATSAPLWQNWDAAGDHNEFVNTSRPLGGIYLVDIRIALGATFRTDMQGSTYLKGVELTTTANNDVEVWNTSPFFTRAGIANAVFAGTTQLSFLGVANDDQWCGNGLHVFAPNVPSGVYSLRANGNWDGIFCVPSIFPNLRLLDITRFPQFTIRGGGLYVASTNTANLAGGSGFVTAIYSPLSAPWCPIQMTNVTATACIRSGSDISSQTRIDNCNMLNTSGAAVVFCEKGATLTLNFLNGYLAGSAPGGSGVGILANNDATVFLNGLPTLTGGLADTRVDGANSQANAFYTAIGVVNPATPVGTGSKIIRIN
jgi:hypothetical protein